MAAAFDYVVRARTFGDGTSVATSKRSENRFDSSPSQGDEPGSVVRSRRAVPG